MPRKRLTGTVVSDKMDKTVVVRVTRWLEHPVYKKRIRRSKKYHAHDEHNECKVGDVVVIEETRPLSRTKRWRVVEILQRAYQAENIPAVEESEEA
ncbi:MAG: 30S ribosomal protein S17 [Thermotoga sp. 50_1627]|uniref:30S ribosomal protein S17 n=1 Tax=Pseudothermotoga sp. TaxID=2033661 RepID=UPI00076D8D3E|nr:MAG: 30S ribosomal protein S17 [Thermotoga sp. 50_64]KUK25384.1 MAG: 30S ribosomal protein S17 [Thermotoga sp. 50_1627]MBC7116797.1 30S ribosomal protein S17 [Pseudothermotoga sp.]MDK2923143.1 small subunit ribosomal protein [Pseudothermotoga sp.]HBT39627.1 30S ribosomal protein S17 [Pseudothermotoga sp.]